MLIGPPGSGKGTQARLLVEAGGWAQLATGDLFREHARLGTELGRRAEGYMSMGQYVPDEITVGMVRDKLRETPGATRLIFDGFPRTVPQADALESLLSEAGRRLGAAILFEVSRDRLLERLGGRATCGDCQASYSLAIAPPAVTGVCDRCGGTVTSTARPDESPEIVRRRLEVYEEQTRPVVDHYAARGVLRRLSGEGGIAEVAARTRALLDEAVPSGGGVG